MTKSAAHLRIIEETSAYWRVLFDNPPLNIVGARIYEDLQDLLARMDARSEEHTSELQSQSNLVCRLLLEKKNPYGFKPPPSITTPNEMRTVPCGTRRTL